MINKFSAYTLHQVVEMMFDNPYSKKEDKQGWIKHNRNNYIRLWKWGRDGLIKTDKRMWVRVEQTVIYGTQIIKFLKGRNPKGIKSELLQWVNEQ